MRLSVSNVARYFRFFPTDDPQEPALLRESIKLFLPLDRELNSPTTQPIGKRPATSIALHFCEKKLRNDPTLRPKLSLTAYASLDNNQHRAENRHELILLVLHRFVLHI